MEKEMVILITEDDPGHALLIKRNLQRAGIGNEIMHFSDGKEVLDFLFTKRDDKHKESHYLLLLDIRMPKVDGVEVLRQIKQDTELCKIPIIMITTTDDPLEVEKCYQLGCNIYITKPVDYDKFVDAIKRLGLFIMVVEIPKINRN